MGQVVEIRRRRKRARTNVKRNVPPGRRKNSDLRTREYLTPDEVSALVKHAGSVGRHRSRDRTLILALYRHGLRVSEAEEESGLDISEHRMEAYPEFTGARDPFGLHAGPALAGSPAEVGR